MRKTSISAWARRAGALLALTGVQAVWGCSTKDAAPRAIRAHTRIMQGVAHADPAGKAERYCSYCHGANLAGGAGFEPSCYQCHGKNWLDDTFAAAVPPATHAIVNGGRYHHMSGQFSPTSSCVACHGADLGGDAGSGLTIPGCNLCHEQLWLTRTPPPGES
jgi:hypothetical protein